MDRGDSCSSGVCTEEEEEEEATMSTVEEEDEVEKQDPAGSQCATGVSTHEARPMPLHSSHVSSPRTSEEGDAPHCVPHTVHRVVARGHGHGRGVPPSLARSCMGKAWHNSPSAFRALCCVQVARLPRRGRRRPRWPRPGSRPGSRLRVLQTCLQANPSVMPSASRGRWSMAMQRRSCQGRRAQGLPRRSLVAAPQPPRVVQSSGLPWQRRRADRTRNGPRWQQLLQRWTSRWPRRRSWTSCSSGCAAPR